MVRGLVTVVARKHLDAGAAPALRQQEDWLVGNSTAARRRFTFAHAPIFSDFTHGLRLAASSGRALVKKELTTLATISCVRCFSCGPS